MRAAALFPLAKNMPPKRGRRDKAAADALVNKIANQELASTEVKEALNLVPQRQIILDNLTVFQGHLNLEDEFRRKKLILFWVSVLSSIIGLVLTLFSQRMTPLFQAYPLNWTVFGIACVFYLPCIAYFWWIMCARWSKFHCWGYHCCENCLFTREHRHRNFLKEQRNERNRVKKLTHLYNEGDLDPPPEAFDPPEVPYEYDPAQPWAYIRWKPKPPIKVRYDEEGVAWIVTLEEQAEAEAKALASKQLRSGADSKDGDDGDEEEGGRRSSVVRKKSSVVER